MEQRIAHIENELRAIKERNARVEIDKAWERSSFRVVSILVITYVIATVALFALGNSRPFLNAFIPVIGFFLSVQSLPFLKRLWVTRYVKKQGK